MALADDPIASVVKFTSKQSESVLSISVLALDVDSSMVLRGDNKSGPIHVTADDILTMIA